MILKRLLLMFVVSGIAVAQTTLRVPSGSPSQCDGPNCANRSQAQDANNGMDDADISDPSAQPDQNSRYDRSSTSGANARTSDQNGRYDRSNQDPPVYRIPADRPQDVQPDREDEFPRTVTEPPDLSPTYPPRKQSHRTQHTAGPNFLYS